MLSPFIPHLASPLVIKSSCLPPSPPPPGPAPSPPLTTHPPNPAPCSTLPPLPPAGLSHFTLLPEDFQLIYAQYYGNIQTISARNVLFHKIKAMGEDALSRLNWFEPDTVHPKDEGHKIYADILIHMFQTYVREQVIRRNEAAAPTASRVMEQLYVLPVEEGPLPTPLVENNYQKAGGFCSMNEDLKQYVISSLGWEWVDEGFPMSNGLPHHKFGYVSTLPGSKLTLMMDATLGGFAGAADGSVQVMLAHLKSYEKMGMASISCLSGCTCTPTKVNGTASIKASLTSFAAITMSNPSAKCILVVENLFDSAVASAAGFVKFKVIGLAMNEKSASKQQYLFSSDHDSYDDNRSG